MEWKNFWGNPGACVMGSVKTVCVDNVDNGEENFFRFIIINLFLGKMVKSAVFYRIFTKPVV